MRISPHIAFSASLLALTFSVGWSQSPPVSKYWQAFKNASNRAPAEIVPDFSYAGYEQGEKAIPDVKGPVFKVTDFGAIPDDNLSDEEAIRKAVAAAQKAGGGVVLFPPGKFLVWTVPDKSEPIRITKSGVVIRGAGMGKGGTLIRAVHSGYATGHYAVPKVGADFDAVPYIFIFKGASDSPSDDESATANTSSTPESAAAKTRLSASSPRADFQLHLESASGYHPGDFIQIKSFSKNYFHDLLADLEPDSTWTRILPGISVNELHQIHSVEGDTLVLREPLLAAHGSEFDSQVFPHPVITNVGVEDIAFQGSWYSPFVHHRSSVDDEGWDGVLLNGVAHGWVRRCAFLNMNTGVYLRDSLHCSMLENRFSGNMGHYNIAVRNDSSFNFLGLTQDDAGNLHSMSTGNRSSGTTVWRWKIKRNQSVDSHGNSPFATLIDCVEGGRMSYSGGPGAAFPNHLRWMIFWNFSYAAEEKMPVDFWKVKKGVAKFVKPLFVGLHGEPVSLVEEALEDNESPGTVVSPESLYEAQLSLRLGAIPPWVALVRKEWEPLQSAELPVHDLAGPDGAATAIRQPENFELADLLTDLTNLLAFQEQGWSLAMEYSKTDAALKLHQDYVVVRTILHAMATYASEGQVVAVNIRREGDRVFIEMPITATEDHKTKCLVYYSKAKSLASACDGSVELTEGRLIFSIPQKIPPNAAANSTASLR